MTDRILVTGGAGFIGSHVLVELVSAGHRPVVLDNLATGSSDAVERASRLAGTGIPLVLGDVRSRHVLERIFSHWRKAGDPVRQVIHLAGSKSVRESIAHPLAYYDVNVCGTAALLQAMLAYGVDHIVFSSSATVYGAASGLPITEEQAAHPCTPYGRSKFTVEQILADICAAQPEFHATVLRYFNPVGAHPSGLIGESLRGSPENLFPAVTQVAAGLRRRLTVFGRDYPTRDGTAVRDYLHVVDLAQGHVQALNLRQSGRGWTAINLGTGRGTTVMEMVRAFEACTGANIPYVVANRRPGDVAELWADVAKARRELGWRPERGLEEMCKDGWRWQAGGAGPTQQRIQEAGQAR